MAVHVVCPKGHPLRIAEKYAGRRGRCPKCGAIVAIPGDVGTRSPPARRPAGDGLPDVCSQAALDRRVDTERKRLRGHLERGSKAMYASSRGYAWSAVAGGSLCTGLGATVFLLSAGVFDVKVEGSRWVGLGAGALFMLVGAGVLTTAIRSLRHLQRVEVLRELHADEPWLADFPWDAEGSRDDTYQQQRYTFAKGGVYLLAAAIIGYLSPRVVDYHHLVPHSPSGLLNNFVVLFALAAFLGYGLWWIGGALYLTVRRQKYGGSEVRFARFPFFLGKELEVTFVPDRDVGDVSRLRVKLRCVEQAIEYVQSANDRYPEVVCYQVWADTIYLRQPFYLAAGRELPIRFALPDRPDLTSDLASRPMRYWELVVWAETAGVDYEAMFLVPVYARPAGATAGPASSVTGTVGQARRGTLPSGLWSRERRS